MLRKSSEVLSNGLLFVRPWTAPSTNPSKVPPNCAHCGAKVQTPPKSLVLTVSDNTNPPTRALCTHTIALSPPNTARVALIARSAVPCARKTDSNQDAIATVWKRTQFSIGDVIFMLPLAGYKESVYETSVLARAARGTIAILPYE